MIIRRKVCVYERKSYTNNRLNTFFIKITSLPRFFYGKMVKVMINGELVDRKVDVCNKVYLGKNFQGDYVEIHIPDEMALEYVKHKLEM